MEVQIRRNRPVAIRGNQENINTIRGKTNILPTKKTGLAVRGALGDLSTNVQAQRDINAKKVGATAAEFEKKASLTRGAVKGTNYGHIQSKIDTGLPSKCVPSSRPPLRREESTAGLAAKAVAHTKIIGKSSETKESINNQTKTTETKKVETKKAARLPTLKEEKGLKTLKPILKKSTESLSKLKPILKESTESLGKLQITDKHLLDSPVLPADIEDIDAGDESCPLLLAIYTKDIYRYLKELEVKYPIEHDFLKRQAVITGKMRATLMDWLVELHQQFSLTPETFQLTVGIIDRYLQEVPTVQRNQLQLVGVTAMFIASKYEEIYAPGVGDFVYVTDSAYTKGDVFRCERDIMTKLGFCLARPIPLSFVRRFVKAAHGMSKNHHLAKYFVDLCLIEYSMSHYRPSELSAASVCLSLYLLSTKSFPEVWTPTLAYYSGYSLDHILPIIRKIVNIVANVPNSRNKAVYNKYLDVSLAKVAGIQQLRSDYLNLVIKEMDGESV